MSTSQTPNDPAEQRHGHDAKPDEAGAPEALRASELRYRSLFESAKHGILLLDAETGMVVDVNPFLLDLLGYSREFFFTKKVWDLGCFGDAVPNEDVFRELQAKGHVRHEDLTLATSDGRPLDVVFFSNVCQEKEHRVLQFHILDIAERRQAERTLADSEYRFSQLLSKAPLGYQSLDIDGRFLDVNQAWLETLGYTRDEVIGKWFGDFLPLEYVQPFRARFETFKKEGVVHSQFFMIHKDGSRRYISFDGKIGHDDDGNFRQTHCILKDDTERKRAEDALVASEAKFRSIFASLAEIVVLHELVFDEENRPVDYRIVECNPSFAKHTGMKCHDVVGRLATDVYGADRAPYLEQYAHVALTGETCAFKAFYAPMNKHFDIRVACPGKNMFVTVTSDISESVRNESYREMGLEILGILQEPGDLRDSVGRVLAVLKAATGSDAVGMRLQDGEDFPYFAEDGFSEDFLLVENTLIQRGRDGDVCRDEDGKVCLECTCGLVISGKTDPANPLFTKGGSLWTNDSLPLLDLPSDEDPRLNPRNNCIHQGYASAALIPVRSGNRIVGLLQLNDKRKGRFTLEQIVILEGIVAHLGSALMRKRAEEERERLQDQLTQAQKMDSVGRLAGGVAHDFNNMLGVILGHTEFAMERVAPTEPPRADLEEIQTAALRAADLTRQLLAFARKQTVAPKALNLNGAVSDMVKMLRRLIPAGIELSWQPGAELWSVRIDPVQVDQILVNLCVNARDAIGVVGKVTIETQNVSVDAACCRKNVGAVIGDYVMVAVSDDGAGMEPETQAHMFEPFFTTKGTGKGCGLGLATVYGIVRQNGGFFDVSSELGQGTTVRIYLPRHAGRAAETKVVERHSAECGGETILLVEDDSAILRVSKRMLKRLGYTVLAASGPGEALRLAREHAGRVDLVMTDVVMPEMNGRDLARSLLAMYPGMRRLYMSGYTSDIIAHHGVLDEGVNFIQKPFSLSDLSVKLRSVLEPNLDSTREHGTDSPRDSGAD